MQIGDGQRAFLASVPSQLPSAQMNPYATEAAVGVARSTAFQ